LKLILLAFEQLSGLKINFHKSELFCFGEAQDEVNEYADLFGCGQGQFPMRYLGIPIRYRRLTLVEWKLVEERLQKRLSSWKGKLLSLGGRLILINSVTGLDSFGKGTVRKRNIDWLNGVSCALPKTRVGLVFMTLRSKI
jgi:hypothetical protein